MAGVQCVRVYLMWWFCWPQAKQCLPLPPLIFPCFICFRSLSLPAHTLNRLAGSWGGWRKRPGESMLSLSFGPTGRDSRYLPAPQRSHHQVCHLLTTPDPLHPPQQSTFFAHFHREPVSAYCWDHTLSKICYLYLCCICHHQNFKTRFYSRSTRDLQKSTTSYSSSTNINSAQTDFSCLE